MTTVVYPGPWWCPACSKASAYTVHTNHGEPACERCGTPLEEQGTGDDAVDEPPALVEADG